MIQKYIIYIYIYKRDISSWSAIPLHQLKLHKLNMLTYHFFFSKKAQICASNFFPAITLDPQWV